MTDEAMSPLRRRMIEDMTIRKLAPKNSRSPGAGGMLVWRLLATQGRSDRWCGLG
jgi:hypothetical protein